MQISTSVLSTLTAVSLMQFAVILLDRTHAHVKPDLQAMEKHALVSYCGVVKHASKTMYVRKFRFPNQRNLGWWNPESWALESGILLKIGIHNPSFH